MWLFKIGAKSEKISTRPHLAFKFEFNLDIDWANFWAQNVMSLFKNLVNPVFHFSS